MLLFQPARDLMDQRLVAEASYPMGIRWGYLDWVFSCSNGDDIARFAESVDCVRPLVRVQARKLLIRRVTIKQRYCNT
jgi:hypothetical protein